MFALKILWEESWGKSRGCVGVNLWGEGVGQGVGSWDA